MLPTQAARMSRLSGWMSNVVAIGVRGISGRVRSRERRRSPCCNQTVAMTNALDASKCTLLWSLAIASLLPRVVRTPDSHPTELTHPPTGHTPRRPGHLAEVHLGPILNGSFRAHQAA